MNENYMIRYINANGELTVRDTKGKVTTVIFAGTKYMFDRIFALLAFVLLLPLFIIIAIAIKLDSKGPVFFRQIRTGKGGRNFIMLKFRTMSADNDVHDFSTEDRHTRVGKFLRKTSLDELPQLINVFGY